MSVALYAIASLSTHLSKDNTRELKWNYNVFTTRVLCSYNTIPYDAGCVIAGCVIAGMVPIELVMERVWRLPDARKQWGKIFLRAKEEERN